MKTHTYVTNIINGILVYPIIHIRVTLDAFFWNKTQKGHGLNVTMANIKNIFLGSRPKYLMPNSYRLPKRNSFYILDADADLSQSHTKHGWAHNSHTVNSVIYGLTRTSIGLQPYHDTSETRM